MKGIIMAGGMGSRLRPLTCNLPKPMVPIFNKPVIEYGAALLKKHSIEEIGFTLFYLPHKIVEHFEDGSKFNISTNYYVEESPLGTGGSVKNADEFLDSTIVVISGDALTDIDLTKAYAFHKKKGSKATLILKKEEIPLEYGVVVTDDEDRIIRFLEKPSWGEVFSDTVNTGIYILEPDVFDYYKKGENFDFSQDLFPRLLKDNIPMYGYTAEGYWSDVGDLKSYMNTHVDILADEKKHHLLGKCNKKGIWIGEGTVIEKNAVIKPPVFIGDNCVIGEGAVIDEYTVLGSNTKVGKGSSIKRSIIWDNVSISNDCEIRKAVVCNNVYIGEHSRVFEDSVIGAYSKLFKGSTINPGVKVWPYKTVNENVVIKQNLIWGEGLSKSLFDLRGISGVYNQNITPEMVVGVGTAFSSTVNKKGTYLVSCDKENLSESLRSAIISGILSTGGQVVVVSDSTIPMARFGIRKFNLDGGVHIRRDTLDEDIVHMEFFNESGANIDKSIIKKMQKSLSFEDYNRCVGKEVKDTVKIDNFSLIYLNDGISLIENIEEIKRQKPRIILYSKTQRITELAYEYLKTLGCEVEVLNSKTDYNIEDIAKIVLEKNMELGIVYGENGETIEITDGKSVIGEEKYYILSLLIELKNGTIEDIVVPYHHPNVIEQLSSSYNANTLSSKTSVLDLIETALEKNIRQYMLNFDAVWASGMIIDYFVSNNTNLNELLKEIPEYFYIKKQIPCKWTDKGNIIRQLSQDKSSKLELIEGVKFIEENGWALIIPNEEKPVLNIYIEGSSKAHVEELWKKYNERLVNMLKEQSNIS